MRRSMTSSSSWAATTIDTGGLTAAFCTCRLRTLAANAAASA
jgi:hypothetical protein